MFGKVNSFNPDHHNHKKVNDSEKTHNHKVDNNEYSKKTKQESSKTSVSSDKSSSSKSSYFELALQQYKLGPNKINTHHHDHSQKTGTTTDVSATTPAAEDKPETPITTTPAVVTPEVPTTPRTNPYVKMLPPPVEVDDTTDTQVVTTPAVTTPAVTTPAVTTPAVGDVKSLKASGPITVTHDGQVIENLLITGTSGNAININGFKNVIIRNCQITANGGAGISASNADGLQIQNVDINNGVAATGVNENSSVYQNNIDISSSNGVTINNAKLTGGSSGIYAADSSNLTFTNIEGNNFKGPFPRGQMVQFNNCNTAVLDGFSCVNDPNNSYPEDNISVYKSQNITIENGLIDGNNSITGCAVMVESGSNNCLIKNVDALNQGDASFVSWGASNVTFEDVRTKDNHATSVRGANASGSLIFASASGATGTSFINATYYNPANPDNIELNYNAPAPLLVKDIKEQDFTAKSPLDLKFSWES